MPLQLSKQRRAASSCVSARPMLKRAKARAPSPNCASRNRTCGKGRGKPTDELARGGRSRHQPPEVLRLVFGTAAIREKRW